MNNNEKLQIINSITGQTILVADNDLGEEMDWNAAKSACEKFGEGWRLPTKCELVEIGKKLVSKENSKFEIDFNYWGSTEGIDSMGCQCSSRYFFTLNEDYKESENIYWLSSKENNFRVRPVKPISEASKLEELTEIKSEGKSLIIAKNDLPKLTSFFEAKEACKLLGNGWRMPLNRELEMIRENLAYKGLGDFKNGMYWAITENGDGEGWMFGNENDSPGFVDLEQDLFSCRPVRDKQ
jgi:hypothetical protein